MNHIFRSVTNRVLHFLQQQNNGNSPKKHTNQKGFSLAEIMIALAIMALVGGGAAIAVNSYFKRAAIKDTIDIMGRVDQARTSFMSDNPDQPCPALDDLAVGKRYLTKPPRDPWGNAFKVLCPGEHGNDFELQSAGPDKKFETEDDIKSWEKPKKQ